VKAPRRDPEARPTRAAAPRGIRPALGLVLALAAAACGTRAVTAAPAGALASAPTDRIRVMEPPDAVEGRTTRLGSGNVVAVRTAEGLRLAGYPDVTVLHATTEPAARKAALAVHARFLAVPTILEWADRTPAFRSNRVRIRVDLHDLADDGRIVRTVTFAAQSRRGIRKPSTPRLLDESYRRAVATLLRPAEGGQ